MSTLAPRARTWAATVNGQYIDTGLPSTPECVDLARHWAMQLGATEKAYGHGRDFAGRLAKEDGWQFIGPDQPAQAGDIASWDWDKYGHVAVVQSDDGATLTVTQQNPRAAHTAAGVTKRGLVGYARPAAVIQAMTAAQADDAGAVTITPGDTLWRIAQRLGTSVAAIKALNAGIDQDNLQPGQQVRVPRAEADLYVVPGAWTLARHKPAGDVIGQLPQGTLVTGTGRTDGDWIEAASPWQAARGASAWYHKNFLRKAA